MKKNKIVAKNPLYFNIVKPELIGTRSKGIHPVFNKHYQRKPIISENDFNKRLKDNNVNKKK
jgi:hypothetical protein